MQDIFVQRKEKLIKEHRSLIDIIGKLEKICSDNEKLDFIKDQYYPQLKNNLSKLEKDRFSLAFIGMKSAGKSTLINSLIDRKNLLPQASKATTATITKIRKRDKEGILVKFKNIKELKEESKKILKLIKSHPDFKYNKENYKVLEEYIEDKDLIGLKEFLKTDESITENVTTIKLIERYLIIDGFLSKELELEIEDSLENIEKYVVESLDGAKLNPNSLRVKEVIIFLNNLDIQEDIELVDLPGLGSEYKSHNEISLNYSETAHAFALLGRGSFDDNDFVNDFVTRVHKEHLKKAFWIFTHCDSKEDEIIEKEKVEARAYLSDKGVEIDKIYSTSAKKYFEDDDKYVDKIEDLREEILEYLNKNVKDEFYSTLENTVTIVKNHILKLSDFTEYSENKEKINTSTFEEEFIDKEAKERSKLLIDNYKTLIESTFDHIEDTLSEIDVWSENNKNNIIERLSLEIDKMDNINKILSYSRNYRKLDGDNKFKDSQSSGVYEYRIIEHIDNVIRFNNLIKLKIESLLKNQIQNSLIEILESKIYSLDDLKETKYLNEIDNILEEFDVSQSIASTIENSFDDYDEYICFINDEIFKMIVDNIVNNKESEEFSRLLKENLDYEISLKNGFKDKDLIQEGLIFYKKSMENYLINLKYSINKNVKRSTVNRLNKVRTNLTELISDPIDIYQEIKSKIDVTEAFGDYQSKFNTLGKIYESIDGVRNENS